MKDKQKYQIFILTVAVLSVYLIFTEVVDRWSEMLDSSKELSTKKESVLNPEVLSRRKIDLLAKKRILTAQMTKANEGFEQSQIGLVRLIQIKAKENNIFLRTLTPTESRTTGQMIELGFALDLLGSYHRLGSYINSLETSPIPIKIVKVEAINQQPGSTVLSVYIQGKAYILSKSILQ
jgi:Tfp pilus assembly protein PilO